MTLVCRRCGSDSLGVPHLVDPNTGEVIEPMEPSECTGERTVFCFECPNGTTTEIVEQREYFDDRACLRAEAMEINDDR